jgi:RNA polymerase sigma-70 factor (ECF subfamily)
MRADDVAPSHGSISDRALRDALQNLSASDQQLLLLVTRERLDRDQLAALLGVSTTTISGRLHHARVRLARALAAQQIRARDHPPRATDPGASRVGSRR